MNQAEPNPLRAVPRPEEVRARLAETLRESHYSAEQLAERAEWVETGLPSFSDFHKQDGRDSYEKMRQLVRSCKLLAQQNTFGWLLYRCPCPLILSPHLFMWNSLDLSLCQ